MSYREFTDARGIRWEVWEVQRDVSERRKTGERRRRLGPPFEGIERRMTSDRRAAGGRGAAASLQTAARTSALGPPRGWLAFQSRHERRRLEPIPPGWEAASEAELVALCETATTQGTRRLLD